MEIRSSTNYAWNTKDRLGEGATGAVFKARHKVRNELSVGGEFSAWKLLIAYEGSIKIDALRTFSFQLENWWNVCSESF